MATPHLGRTGVCKSPRASLALVTWPDVVGVLQDPEARALALGTYAKAGHTSDLFARRREARTTMARCLTLAEDYLETWHPSLKFERQAIKQVRRRLEAEQ